jgi:hypothetical protein
VDAAVVRLPFPTDQLHVTVRYDEPRVLRVALDHHLAGKESMTLDHIADEPLPRGRPTPPGILTAARHDGAAASICLIAARIVWRPSGSVIRRRDTSVR